MLRHGCCDYPEHSLISRAMTQYHLAKNKEPLGVFAESEIRTMLATGAMEPSDLCWAEGMDKWKPLNEVIQTGDTSPHPMAPPPLPANIKQVRPEDDLGMRMLIPVGRSAWAIAAGYLGIFALVILPAPLALIISIIAIRDLRKSRNSTTPKYGMGRAVFGLVMGILGTIVIVLILLNSR